MAYENNTGVPSRDDISRIVAERSGSPSMPAVTAPRATQITPEMLELGRQARGTLAPPPRSGGGGFIMKALGFLDMPRSILASTLQETIDVFQGEGFSTEDWSRQIGEHHGFGDIIADLGIEAGLGGWGNRIIGFTGDVLMDPLTWVGGLGVYNRMRGAKGLITDITPRWTELSQLGAKATIKQKKELAALNTALKVLGKKKSVSAARTALLKGHKEMGAQLVKELGMETGLRFRLPGTGPVLGRVSRFSPLVESTSLQRTKQIPEAMRKSIAKELGDENVLGGLVLKAARKETMEGVPLQIQQVARRAARLPIEVVVPKPFNLGNAFARIQSMPGSILSRTAVTRLGQGMGTVFGTPESNWAAAMVRSNNPDDVVLGTFMKNAYGRGATYSALWNDTMTKASSGYQNRLVGIYGNKYKDDVLLGRITSQVNMETVQAIRMGYIETDRWLPVATYLAKEFPDVPLEDIANIRAGYQEAVVETAEKFLKRIDLYGDDGYLAKRMADIYASEGGYTPHSLTRDPVGGEKTGRALLNKIAESWETYDGPGQVPAWIKNLLAPDTPFADISTLDGARKRMTSRHLESRSWVPDHFNPDTGKRVKGTKLIIPTADGSGKFYSMTLRRQTPQPVLNKNGQPTGKFLTSHRQGWSTTRQIDELFRRAGWIEEGESLFTQGYARRENSYSDSLSRDVRLRAIESYANRQGLIFNFDDFSNYFETIEKFERLTAEARKAWKQVERRDAKRVTDGPTRAEERKINALKNAIAKIDGTAESMASKKRAQTIRNLDDWVESNELSVTTLQGELDELNTLTKELLDSSGEVSGLIEDLEDILSRVYKNLGVQGFYDPEYLLSRWRTLKAAIADFGDDPSYEDLASLRAMEEDILEGTGEILTALKGPKVSLEGKTISSDELVKEMVPFIDAIGGAAGRITRLQLALPKLKKVIEVVENPEVANFLDDMGMQLAEDIQYIEKTLIPLIVSTSRDSAYGRTTTVHAFETLKKILKETEVLETDYYGGYSEIKPGRKLSSEARKDLKQFIKDAGERRATSDSGPDLRGKPGVRGTGFEAMTDWGLQLKEVRVLEKWTWDELLKQSATLGPDEVLARSARRLTNVVNKFRLSASLAPQRTVPYGSVDFERLIGSLPESATTEDILQAIADATKRELPYEVPTPLASTISDFLPEGPTFNVPLRIVTQRGTLIPIDQLIDYVKKYGVGVTDLNTGKRFFPRDDPMDTSQGMLAKRGMPQDPKGSSVRSRHKNSRKSQRRKPVEMQVSYEDPFFGVPVLQYKADNGELITVIFDDRGNLINAATGEQIPKRSVEGMSKPITVGPEMDQPDRFLLGLVEGTGEWPVTRQRRGMSRRGANVSQTWVETGSAKEFQQFGEGATVNLSTRRNNLRAVISRGLVGGVGGPQRLLVRSEQPMPSFSWGGAKNPVGELPKDPMGREIVGGAGKKEPVGDPRMSRVWSVTGGGKREFDEWLKLTGYEDNYIPHSTPTDVLRELHSTAAIVDFVVHDVNKIREALGEVPMHANAYGSEPIGGLEHTTVIQILEAKPRPDMPDGEEVILEALEDLMYQYPDAVLVFSAETRELGASLSIRLRQSGAEEIPIRFQPSRNPDVDAGIIEIDPALHTAQGEKGGPFLPISQTEIPWGGGNLGKALEGSMDELGVDPLTGHVKRRLSPDDDIFETTGLAAPEIGSRGVETTSAFRVGTKGSVAAAKKGDLSRVMRPVQPLIRRIIPSDPSFARGTGASIGETIELEHLFNRFSDVDEKIQRIIDDEVSGRIINEHTAKVAKLETEIAKAKELVVKWRAIGDEKRALVAEKEQQIYAILHEKETLEAQYLANEKMLQEEVISAAKKIGQKPPDGTFSINDFSGDVDLSKVGKNPWGLFKLFSDNTRMWGAHLPTTETGRLPSNVTPDDMKRMNIGWRIGGNQQFADNFTYAMLAAQKMNDRKEIEGFLKAFDTVHNWMKAQLVATPGFVMRNVMGGMFNMWVDDIPLSETLKTMKLMTQAYKAGDGDLHVGVKILLERSKNAKPGSSLAKQRLSLEHAEKLMDVGAHAGGQAASSVEKNLRLDRKGQWVFGTKGGVKDGYRISLAPWDAGFFAYQGIRHVNTYAEEALRLATGIHAMNMGGTLGDSLDTIYRLHFNYSNLSAWESGVFKRAMPFYTWSRNNLPLQMTQMVKNPKRYNRLLQIKDNLEHGEERENLVPDFFLKPLGVQLPFTSNGNQVYSVPDLPFQDLLRFDPTQDGFSSTLENIISSGTPIVKVPLEYWSGKQVFKGIPYSGRYQQVPQPWRSIPGLMESLGAVGWAERNRKGDWKMLDFRIGLLDGYIPFLGRWRRLIPNETRYQERLSQTLISTLAGVNVRFNSRYEQEMERIRRDIKKDLDKQQDRDIMLRER